VEEITGENAGWVCESLLTWIDSDPYGAVIDIPVFLDHIKPAPLQNCARRLWNQSVRFYAESARDRALHFDRRTYTC